MTGSSFQLEVFHRRSPFRFRVRHAHGERSGNEGLVIRISGLVQISNSMHGLEEAKDQRRIFGLGEALPRSYVTGETVDGSLAHCQSLFEKLAMPVMVAATSGGGRLDSAIDLLMDAWSAVSATNQLAVWSAFDVALFDWLSKALDLSPERLLLEIRSKIESRPGNQLRSTNDRVFSAEHILARRATIPMIRPWLAAMLTFGYRCFGFKHFKVKVGDPLSIQRVGMVAQFMGPLADVTLDANQGYSPEAAHQFLKQIFWQNAALRQQLAAFEDPVGPADAESLALFGRDAGIVIMADEVLSGEESCRAFALCPEVSIWNIRVGKCGGITGALMAVDQARRAGARVAFGALVGEDRVLGASAKLLSAHVSSLWREESFSGLVLARSVFRPDRLQNSAASPAPHARRGLGFDLDERVMRSQMIRFQAFRARMPESVALPL